MNPMNPKPSKLWTLYYNGDLVLQGVPWAVLKDKQNKMVRSGCISSLFRTEYHKDISRLSPKRYKNE